MFHLESLKKINNLTLGDESYIGSKEIPFEEALKNQQQQVIADLNSEAEMWEVKERVEWKRTYSVMLKEFSKVKGKIKNKIRKALEKIGFEGPEEPPEPAPRA